MPLVSVIMPARQAVATLGASVRSVQEQTHPDWELLVTDDASTDGSGDLLAALADNDPRIRPSGLDAPTGAAGARNEAISRARGDYVAFLDADDLWLPEKLERQLAFAADANTPLTYTAYAKVDPAFSGDVSDWTPGTRVVQPPANVGYRQMLQQDWIGCLTAMYDRNALGVRLMPDLRKRHDYALWLSILRDGTVARGLTEVLALYRAHRTGSLSSNRLSLVKYNWRLLRELEGLSRPRAARSLAENAVRSTLKRRI